MGKRANISLDGKRFPSPIDTRNTRGVTRALPAFGIWYTRSLIETLRKRRFEPFLCEEALISLQPSRPIYAEAWRFPGIND